MCRTINFNDPDGKKTNDPRYVTVGYTGKNALFTQRGKDPYDGYIRVDGRTVSGFVPGFRKGGKVFYAYLGRKNAQVVRKAA